MQPNSQKKPNIVPIVPVEGSSAIVGRGYDASKGILAVQFKGGKVYNYAGVSPDVVDKMNKAESLGKFVSANIVGKYEQYVEKV